MESLLLNQGLYILILRLTGNTLIQAGRLPETTIKPGIYLYVGRARKNLSARLKRHLRKVKKRFWHIDYLLQQASIEHIWIKLNFYDECQIVSRILTFCPETQSPIKGFGASDCRCWSHLVHLPNGKEQLNSIIHIWDFEEVSFDENNF